MMLVYLYLLTIVLATRARWIFRDQAVSQRTLITTACVQVAALLALSPLGGTLLLLASLLFANWLTWCLEVSATSDKARLGFRQLTLAWWMVTLAVFCSNWSGITFNTYTTGLAASIASMSDALSMLTTQSVLSIFACCTGILLAVSESHAAVRFCFQALNVRPREDDNQHPDAPGKVDQDELNRGRVIGALERLVTFFLVLTGNYSAVGFLLTAKGVTRFKQLDQREFAEYFLVGTLLSIIFAGSAALGIGYLLTSW